jgi:flavin prenyltransferase
MQHPFVVAITGASGAVYAVRLLECLLQAQHCLHVTISPSGAAVIQQELGIEIDVQDFRIAQLLPHITETQNALINIHAHNNFMAPIASGSFRTAGMVICPCSGSTMSGIAHGTSNNLIQRAADVHLKEQRKLIVVPRETPVSSIQLENMKRVADAGGIVLPAMPGWYHGVNSLQDLIDFVVARILDQLGVEHQLMQRWGEK